MKKTFYSCDQVLYLHFETSGVLNGYLQRNNSPIRQSLNGIYIAHGSGLKLCFFIERNFGEKLNTLMAFSGEIGNASNKETMLVNFLTINENLSQSTYPALGEMAFTTEKPEVLSHAYRRRNILFRS